MHSIEIDDVGLKRKLTRELERLFEAGEALPLAELLARPATWPGVELESPAEETVAVSQIYRAACKGVVAVGKLYRCTRCGKRHTSIASGFVVASAGLVVTSHHVVDDPQKETLGVMTVDGSVYPVRAVLRADRSGDLAVLRVRASDLVALPLGDEPPVGAPVWVLSHPAGRLFSLTAGLVSRYSSRHAADREGVGSHSLRLMTVTADFARGSSGGPVLDATGAVVGVARQTKSVYHHAGEDGPHNLQMVLKHCTPARALQELLA